MVFFQTARCTLLCTSTHSNARLLDRCMHTSTRTLWFIQFPGRADTAYSCFHGCTLRAARPSGSHRDAPHPCTVTAAHHLHTRPPDARLEYQGSLVNTYFSLDLRRIRANAEALTVALLLLSLAQASALISPTPPAPCRTTRPQLRAAHLQAPVLTTWQLVKILVPGYQETSRS